MNRTTEKRAKDVRRGDQIVLRVVANKNEQASGIQAIQCEVVKGDASYRLTIDATAKVTVLE